MTDHAPSVVAPAGIVYGDPNCEHEWSGPLDKHPTCVKCDFAYQAPASERRLATRAGTNLLGALDRLDLKADWDAEEREVLRAAIVNVLAHRASPPEYPGLALVPVADLDALSRAATPASGEPAPSWSEASKRLMDDGDADYGEPAAPREEQP